MNRSKDSLGRNPQPPDIERDTIEWLYWLAKQDRKSAVALIALPWVQDSITETERDAIEWLYWLADEDSEAVGEVIVRSFLESLESEDVSTIRRMTERGTVENNYLSRISQSYPETAKALLDLAWVQNIETETDRLAIEWLYWLAREDQETAAAVIAFPWIQDGITQTESHALEWPYWLAREDQETADAVIAFPWIQNGITQTGVHALEWIRWLAKNSKEAGDVAVTLPWVQDDITETENDALKWISWLANANERTAAAIISLPWVQDGITDTELDAVKQLYWLTRQQNGGRNIANLEAVLGLPWIQDNITVTEADFLDFFEDLDNDHAKEAAAVINMPFLKSLEEDDVLALRGVERLGDKDLLSVLMSHPTLTSGITDAQTTLIIAAGTLLDAEEIRRMLTPGYASIETLSSGTTLTPDLKVSIVRTGSQPQPGIAAGIGDAVEFAEEIMHEPLPASHVIVVLNDKAFNPLYGGANHGFAFSLHPEGEKPRDTLDGHYFLSAIVHETAHYFWRGMADWIDEGVADLFEYLYGVQSGISPGLLETPEREDCEAHDLEMLTGWDPEQENKEAFLCNYYLGQSLFLDLLENLGEDELTIKLRDLYHLAVTKKETGAEPGIEEVRQAFHNQAEIVEKHWSGKLNAPETRPFDEGRYRRNHGLIQWDQFPTYDGEFVAFSGTLLGDAVLSLGTLDEATEGGNTQNFDLYPADGYEFAGWILPYPMTWKRIYPGTATAAEYRLEGKTFTIKFPFQEALGDPAEYVVNVKGYSDESRTPYIGENIDILGYARIRVE